MKELLAALQALGDNADAKAIAAAVQQHAQAAYQVAYNAGHSTATQAKNTEIQTLTAERDQHKAASEKATQDLEAERKKHPELQQLRDQHAQEITRLNDAHKTEVKKLTDGAAEKDRQRAVADARAYLVGEKKVDPVYADALLANPDVAKRIRLAQDGAVEFLQKGQDIPIAVGADQKAHALFGDSLLPDIPKKFVGSTADGGAGITNGAPGGTTGNTFDAIRTEVAERNKKAAEAQAAPSLQQRFGIAPAG